MKSTSTKLPFFTFLCSFFAHGERVSKNKTTEIKSELIQPLDLYTQYRNLYLNPDSSIRSRARDLNISRGLSEKMTKQLKNVQRNIRIKK